MHTLARLQLALGFLHAVRDGQDVPGKDALEARAILDREQDALPGERRLFHPPAPRNRRAGAQIAVLYSRE
jgi:hypothetical protein